MLRLALIVAFAALQGCTSGMWATFEAYHVEEHVEAARGEILRSAARFSAGSDDFVVSFRFEGDKPKLRASVGSNAGVALLATPSRDGTDLGDFLAAGDLTADGWEIQSYEIILEDDHRETIGEGWRAAITVRGRVAAPDEDAVDEAIYYAEGLSTTELERICPDFERVSRLFEKVGGPTGRGVVAVGEHAGERLVVRQKLIGALDRFVTLPRSVLRLVEPIDFATHFDEGHLRWSVTVPCKLVFLAEWPADEDWLPILSGGVGAIELRHLTSKWSFNFWGLAGRVAMTPVTLVLDLPWFFLQGLLDDDDDC